MSTLGRILLVEDDPNDVELTLYFLGFGKSGCQCRYCAGALPPALAKQNTFQYYRAPTGARVA